MIVELDVDKISDELYNMLLQNFVDQAVAQGLPINKSTQVKTFTLACEFTRRVH